MKLPGQKEPVGGRRGTQRSLAGSKSHAASQRHLSISLSPEYVLSHACPFAHAYICSLIFWQSQTLLMLIESHNLWPARLISCCNEHGGAARLFIYEHRLSTHKIYTTCKIKRKEEETENERRLSHHAAHEGESKPIQKVHTDGKFIFFLTRHFFINFWLFPFSILYVYNILVIQ